MASTPSQPSDSSHEFPFFKRPTELAMARLNTPSPRYLELALLDMAEKRMDLLRKHNDFHTVVFQAKIDEEVYKTLSNSYSELHATAKEESYQRIAQSH